MNKENLQKIVLGIVGIILFFVFLYLFFYVALFFLIVGLILYIYYKLFKEGKPKTYAKTKSKGINNVVMDAEYKEKK